MNRYYKPHSVMASKEFIAGQEQGQYTTKKMRTNRVNEVRASHFSLGSDPSTLHSSKHEKPEFVNEKWNSLKPVTKTGSNVPAKQTNFAYNEGFEPAEPFQSTSGHAYQHTSDQVVFDPETRRQRLREIR